MIRVRWTESNTEKGRVHIGTAIGVATVAPMVIRVVVADDDGPIVQLPLEWVTNASASPVQQKKVTASGVTL